MSIHLEIEKKFLVSFNQLPELKDGDFIKQSYIFISNKKEIRIRIMNRKCTLSIKVTLNNNAREEYNYTIPLQEGEKLVSITTSFPPIEKLRYNIYYENNNWAVDVFLKQNTGLVIAEIELKHSEQLYSTPPWVIEEVTHNLNYYNSRLYKYPYKFWKD